MKKSITHRVIAMIVWCIIIILIVPWIIMDFSYVSLLGAIRNNQNKKVELLLKLPFRSLDKTSGYIPLRWIVESGENNSPLELACRFGNYQAAKMLIEKGADASCVQEDHFSLLYLAMESTESEDYKLVKLLVENGADPNGAPEDDHDNSSSLENCARMDCGDYYFNNYLPTAGSWEEELKKRNESKYDEKKAVMIRNIYQYLEERIQNYNNPEEQISGTTTLHWAANYQNLELIQYLIDQGKYGVNDQDHEGKTCLHFLVCYDEPDEYDKEWKRDTLELLIQNGADPTIKDKEGKTPYDYTVENKDDYLAGLLEPYMRNAEKSQKGTD